MAFDVQQMADTRLTPQNAPAGAFLLSRSDVERLLTAQRRAARAADVLEGRVGRQPAPADQAPLAVSARAAPARVAAAGEPPPDTVGALS